MFSSSIIKALCYFAFGIILIASLILFGFSAYAVYEGYGGIAILMVVISTVIPVFSIITLYPIFALASIQQYIKSIDENVSWFYRDMHETFVKIRQEKVEINDARLIKKDAGQPDKSISHSSKTMVIGKIGTAPFKMR